MNPQNSPGLKHNYIKYTNQDRFGNNIKQIVGKTIDELKELCSANNQCKAFSSDGWIKSVSDRPLLKSNNDYYIKSELI